ncbi:DUF2851 family protein, partial [bacterium]|nr:DUF2851 family protein [bacterium]
MSEKIIQAIWHHLFLKMEELAATDGTPIKILDRGVWNNDAGPDFKEAKIKIGENVMTGDVEVHWKTSDWKHHRHTENSSYDKVILHVVFIDDDEEKRIPTLEIRNYLSDNLINIVKKIHAIQEDQKNIFCYDTAPRLEPGFMDRWVLENGRERLEEKCRKFETQMIQQGADFDQILYQGMMDALGFSKNREPFQKLSNKITYRMLMDSIAHDEEATALMRLQAILFGAGGFLTEVKSLQVVPFVQRLENLWAEFQSKHGTVPM